MTTVQMNNKIPLRGYEWDWNKYILGNDHSGKKCHLIGQGADGYFDTNALCGVGTRREWDAPPSLSSENLDAGYYICLDCHKIAREPSP